MFYFDDVQNKETWGACQWNNYSPKCKIVWFKHFLVNIFNNIETLFDKCWRFKVKDSIIAHEVKLFTQVTQADLRCFSCLRSITVSIFFVRTIWFPFYTSLQLQTYSIFRKEIGEHFPYQVQHDIKTGAWFCSVLFNNFGKFYW